ncbi:MULTISPECIES: hypothetical protein [unclassified Sphingomonas]|uniref:hypothetical protein n=1 Tax=unclassified Sphingomonas TaxID=196159 RepID=UPI00082F36E5|nr:MULTISPECIES: hypothetical protein [unclassified Sphingomonas]MCH4892929.1 hypothetical protein [Sphingomonas sp. SFZ2018-12]
MKEFILWGLMILVIGGAAWSTIAGSIEENRKNREQAEKDKLIADLQRRAQESELVIARLTTQDSDEVAHLSAHIKRLEQRIRVLERVVTDRGTVLAHEIDALRDEAVS